MKRIQKIANYLCLEAGVQGRNKRMARSKNQSFLFRDGISHAATVDDVGLLQDLHGKTLVRFI